MVGILGQSSYTALEEPPVPTRNVNLTKELDRFVARSVKRGRYANASEVMRSALRLLELEERENKAKLAALRRAIAEGDASGDAEPGVFDRIRKKYGLSKKVA
jgi:antitoxin ParD1/3/4